MIRTLNVCGVTLEADCAGVLHWPQEGALIVADLHFEKGSSFAMRGMLVPPYDTAATLSRLAQLIARYAPRLVIALGDSFHDGGGPARLSAADRDRISELQRGRDWLWVAGNHDPDPAADIGGRFAPSFALGPLTFRHEPTGEAGEISGHLHPSARVSWRGQTIVRRCFAANRRCVVMPAFGAYTGGLSIRNLAFGAVFGALDFTAHLMGERRVFSIPAAHCL
jgi:DNA ligase-associated metallophosphoesterase